MTVYREGADPLESRTHMHVKTRLEAEFHALTFRPAHGYDVALTRVDVGKDAKKALVELANNPNWLQERPRTLL